MYYLANQGYIVFTIDGRGSENRGRDFEQVILRELGAIEMIDQIKGYDYLVKQNLLILQKLLFMVGVTVVL